ncbi:hypothetical protein [Kineococcus sp. NPDC059986]|uniref:hypothetical protein n=1 Tax=Kineococcus sp. NPDC059986 TaxID=3155538 RepID=UPI00344D3CE9
MPNTAVSTVTFFALDPAVLAAVREQVRPSVPRYPGHALSLEAAVPTGLDLDAWDDDRAFTAWGTSRPETDAELVRDLPDRLVYEVGTPWSGPETVWATLSGQHPGLVVHSVSSDGSEFLSRGWYVEGRAALYEEQVPEIDEIADDGDEEVHYPQEWAFSEAEARRLLGDGGPVG